MAKSVRSARRARRHVERHGNEHRWIGPCATPSRCLDDTLTRKQFVRLIMRAGARLPRHEMDELWAGLNHTAEGRVSLVDAMSLLPDCRKSHSNESTKEGSRWHGSQSSLDELEFRLRAQVMRAAHRMNIRERSQSHATTSQSSARLRRQLLDSFERDSTVGSSPEIASPNFAVVWSAFDVDGTNRLDAAKLSAALRCMGYRGPSWTLPGRIIRRLLRRMDRRCRGFIDYDDFCAWATLRRHPPAHLDRNFPRKSEGLASAPEHAVPIPENEDDDRRCTAEHRAYALAIRLRRGFANVLAELRDAESEHLCSGDDDSSSADSASSNDAAEGASSFRNHVVAGRRDFRSRHFTCSRAELSPLHSDDTESNGSRGSWQGDGSSESDGYCGRSDRFVEAARGYAQRCLLRATEDRTESRFQRNASKRNGVSDASWGWGWEGAEETARAIFLSMLNRSGRGRRDGTIGVPELAASLSFVMNLDGEEAEWMTDPDVSTLAALLSLIQVTASCNRKKLPGHASVREFVTYSEFLAFLRPHDHQNARDGMLGCESDALKWETYDRGAEAEATAALQWCTLFVLRNAVRRQRKRRPREFSLKRSLLAHSTTPRQREHKQWQLRSGEQRNDINKKLGRALSVDSFHLLISSWGLPRLTESQGAVLLQLLDPRGLGHIPVRHLKEVLESDVHLPKMSRLRAERGLCEGIEGKRFLPSTGRYSGAFESRASLHRRGFKRLGLVSGSGGDTVGGGLFLLERWASGSKLMQRGSELPGLRSWGEVIEDEWANFEEESATDDSSAYSSDSYEGSTDEGSSDQTCSDEEESPKSDFAGQSSTSATPRHPRLKEEWRANLERWDSGGAIKDEEGGVKYFVDREATPAKVYIEVEDESKSEDTTSDRDDSNEDTAVQSERLYAKGTRLEYVGRIYHRRVINQSPSKRPVTARSLDAAQNSGLTCDPQDATDDSRSDDERSIGDDVIVTAAGATLPNTTRMQEAVDYYAEDSEEDEGEDHMEMASDDAIDEYSGRLDSHVIEITPMSLKTRVLSEHLRPSLFARLNPLSAIDAEQSSGLEAGTKVRLRCTVMPWGYPSKMIGYLEVPSKDVKETKSSARQTLKWRLKPERKKKGKKGRDVANGPMLKLRMPQRQPQVSPLKGTVRARSKGTATSVRSVGLGGPHVLVELMRDYGRSSEKMDIVGSCILPLSPSVQHSGSLSRPPIEPRVVSIDVVCQPGRRRSKPTEIGTLTLRLAYSLSVSQSALVAHEERITRMERQQEEQGIQQQGKRSKRRKMPRASRSSHGPRQVSALCVGNLLLRKTPPVRNRKGSGGNSSPERKEKGAGAKRGRSGVTSQNVVNNDLDNEINEFSVSGPDNASVSSEDRYPEPRRRPTRLSKNRTGRKPNKTAELVSKQSSNKGTAGRQSRFLEQREVEVMRSR